MRQKQTEKIDLHRTSEHCKLVKGNCQNDQARRIKLIKRNQKRKIFMLRQFLKQPK